MNRPLVVVALLLALVGCAAPTAVAPQPAGATTAAVGREGVIPAPVAVEIPVIGAASSLVPLGLNPDGTLAVPPITDPGQASWFDLGVIPGEIGPAVIAGHVSGRVDGLSVPGVFARLAELEPGDEIIVARHGADPLTWRVSEVNQYGKDRFPAVDVYGDTDGPELKLITCGGEFDPEERHYQDNIVVTAVPA